MLRLNCQIVGYSLNPPTSPSLFYAAKLNEKIETYYNDIRDFEKFEECVFKFKPDIVIHCAAQSLVSVGYTNPIETYSTNIMGTINLFEILKKINLECLLVNVTSDKCYIYQDKKKSFIESDPLGGKDPYSSSKACSELITYAYNETFFKDKSNVSLVSVRSGNVIGGGDWASNRIVPDIFSSYLNKEPLKIRNPSYVRPWQHVLEPLVGYLRLIEKLFINKNLIGAWNFGPSTNDQLSVIELVQKFSKKIKFDYIENTDPLLVKETDFLMLDSKKAKKYLKWNNVLTIDETIDLIIEWFQRWNSSDDVEEFTSNQIEFYFGKLRKSKS